MTNLTPRPKATGHEVSEDLGSGRGRGKFRPLLFPGPWLRVEIIRGSTTPSPAGPRPRGHCPHRDLPAQGSVGPGLGPRARQQQPGEAVWRGGRSPPSWAPPRAGIRQAQSGSPGSRGCGTERTSCGHKSHKVYLAGRSAYRASRQEPGARWVPWALRPPADPLQVGELSLLTAPRASVSPRRLGLPAPRRPIGSGSQAPPPDGSAPGRPRPCRPHRPFQALRTAPLHAGKVALRLNSHKVQAAE